MSDPSNAPVVLTGFTGQVSKVIDVIRPAIQADGGDIALVGANEDTGVVQVKLSGACVSCPSSTDTIKKGVERLLKDRVPGVRSVEQVSDVPSLDNLQRRPDWP